MHKGSTDRGRSSVPICPNHVMEEDTMKRHSAMSASTVMRMAVVAVAELMSFSAIRAVAQDRTQIPLPYPPFRGEIGRTIEGSKPDYPQPVRAPQGAPNVLLILLDDVGFGMTSTFGGPVPTPNLDKLA